ncbi:flagellar hook-associated protein FlgK [Noviherbaspirillum aerium]|uniref:flagellar hook-associated protein FlgK n=1 Tax=Noviherbaspirillum aerium TaxID=2588497 RepID=UPI00124F2632|nr:flagellar hook-associated protein FlgK [Noviherbaspirillum aerium]
MGSSILNVGQSALAAAQAGLVTTGHNIANASTPGYSRQVVVQGSQGSQFNGSGFLGKGTEVTDIRRIYDNLLAERVRSAQTSQNQAETYYNQISQINNVLADTTAGLTPALQDFFKGMQDLASNPGAAASRQAALSNAEAMASRFQGLDRQLSELESSVNSQIQSSIGSINVYAKQIAKLNDAIEKATATSDGKIPNDLLDQRDYAITELSKEIKTSIVKQGNSYNVFIGNGQPLVVGVKTSELVPAKSTSDPERITVGVQSNGSIIAVADSSLPGGKLGGLLEFRTNSLDIARNSLGRVALGMAMTINAQHRLGEDQNGDLGGDFFSVATNRSVTAATTNNSVTNAKVNAVISDISAVTTSDYRMRVSADGANFTVTRVSDNFAFPPIASGGFPVTIDGVSLSLASGTLSANDEFLIRPTAGAASEIEVAIKDISKIAAAAPVRTSAAGTNTGTGKITAGTVDRDYLAAAPTLPSEIRLTYAGGAPGTLTVTPASVSPPGFPKAYTDGEKITIAGISFAISGKLQNNDFFSIVPNDGAAAVGDNRNAVLLGGLQTKSTLGGNGSSGEGTTTFQGAYAQLVSQIGNKTRETEVTGKAETKYLEQAVTAHEAQSGVNLDEEATNLLRYQQAYQAAGKVMQTANQLFELLLSLGGQ